MLVLILVFVTLIGYWYWNRYIDNLKEPPALPGALPIIGHAHSMIGDSCYLWNLVNDMAQKSYSIGGVVSVYIGPRTCYVLTDPDDCFTVANTCLQKDRFYDFAKPWLGDGLVTGTLSIWRPHRKLLNPAFSQVVLDGFIGVFNKQSRRLVDELAAEAGKGPFDHWLYTRHNALETIGLTALGVDFGENSELNRQYVEATETIFNTIVERFQKFWWHSPHTFRWSNIKKTQDACLKILHSMSDTVLKRKKTELNNNPTKNNNDIKPNTEKDGKFKVFMDLLLELALEKGVLSDREIREHVDTMIVGGHDTSANVLMFTMILLGSHPDVQEKAFAEINEVFEGSDRDVEKHDLPKLVYLEAVLKESMRIYTIVPVIARWLEKDVKLKNHTLSAGRTCFMLVFGLHKHPVWGPDAHEFKPERWLDPTKLPDSPNAFAAFSVGRRMCIGKAYALMSMKTTLTYLIRNYRMKADHTKLVLKLDVMLKPDSGYFISIEKRKEAEHFTELAN